MKIRFTLRARADLEEISDYIRQRNPEAARRIATVIQRSIKLLGAFPARGRKQKTSDVRKVGAGKYPYDIYYRIDQTELVIVVLQVHHAARRQRHRNS